MMEHKGNLSRELKTKNKEILKLKITISEMKS